MIPRTKVVSRVESEGRNKQRDREIERSTGHREEEKNQRVSRADLSMHAGMGLGVGCEVAAPTCQCTDAGVRTSTTLRHSIWSRVSAMGSWEADGGTAWREADYGQLHELSRSDG